MEPAITFSLQQPRTTILTRSALEEPKEVALMVSINTQMATQSPSAFGTPICGHANETTLRSTLRSTMAGGTATATATGARTSVVRDRQVTLVSSVKGAVKGDMGIALAYFPGTPAWRPPIC